MLATFDSNPTFDQSWIFQTREKAEKKRCFTLISRVLLLLLLLLDIIHQNLSSPIILNESDKFEAFTTQKANLFSVMQTLHEVLV